MRELRLLSVVAPMLDEEGLAREFYARVAAALEGVPFELIVVDDGSTDGTPAILDEVAAADERVRVLHLSRPFGHQMAITAGLDHARGDAVGDDRRRPPGPARGDPRAARRAGARAPTSSSPSAASARARRASSSPPRAGSTRHGPPRAGRARAQRRRLPAVRPPRRSTRCCAARALPLPARDDAPGSASGATSSSTTAPPAAPGGRSSRSGG